MDVYMPVTNSSQFNQIDLEDFWNIREHNWCEINGHLHASVDGVRMTITQFLTGKKHIDHIDRNPFNNRRSNFRDSTFHQNSCNQSKWKRPTSSKFKGVSFNKRNKNWQAYINYKHKRIHVGVYSTEIEAAIAYNEKAIELHREYASLNTIPNETVTTGTDTGVTRL